MIDQIMQLAGVIIAVGAAFEVVRRVGRWVWRTSRRIDQHLTEQRDINELVRYQLTPNSGHSLIDRVRVVEEFVQEQRQRIAQRERERAQRPDR